MAEYFNKEIILKKVRINFADGIFEPKSYKGGKARYSCALIVADDVNKKLIDEAVEEIGSGAFKGDWAKNLKKWTNDNRYLFVVKDSDRYGPGDYVLSANRGADRGPVKVVDRDPSVELSADDAAIRSGYRVNAKINIWAQTKDNPGIRAELVAIQLVAKDEVFGTNVEATADGFESIEDDMPVEI